jgi:hypothetical protein
MLRAYEVMNDAAVFYNDANRTVLTYSVQLPYLNMALSELKEYFGLYDIPVTNKSVEDIEVAAGVTEIIFNAVGSNPSLPADLIEPLKLWERNSGSTESFIPMQKNRFLPSIQQTASLINWAWLGQAIKLIGATNDVEVRIDYTKDLFAQITDPNAPIEVLNVRTFLSYRIAGLCSEFIGENQDRAGSLNTFAAMGLDRVLGIGVKGGQAIATRRRPFRSGFKMWNTSL